MPPRKSLRILCFGDSLTSGFYNWGLQSRPYSIVLKERLEQEFPETTVEVRTNGLPGDVASFNAFAQRFRNEYVGGKVFDWVIVLGGTNDIAMVAPSKQIYSGLRAVWDYALSKGSKVLALTVPETHTRVEWVSTARAEINSRILGHEAKGFYTFNLMPHIPYFGLSELDRNKYWDDGVHLTADGYDWMGTHIAEALITVMSVQPKEEDNLSAKPTVASAGGPVPTEDVVWEEEETNARDITQGYVVVRKKDLD